MAELSDTAKIILGAFSGISNAMLSPSTSASTAAPAVASTPAAFPKEWLMIGGLAAVALVAIVLVMR